jgi:folate-binding protein YgfZ
MDWPGLEGFDVVGPATLPPDGVRECSSSAYEVLRIEAGFPRMGSELDERTIPAEAGDALLRRSVSFTKGCYTGQELVARIDSRGGNVPKKLHRVVVEGHDVPPAGATIRAGDRDIGVITSAAFSPGLDAPVAMGYVQRGVDAPASVALAWEGASARARIENLPSVAADA